MIAPSPHEAGTAFVVFDDHRRSDMRPHVYRVDNYGERWTSLVTSDISGYALSVLQDHIDPDLLFLGTEFGLFVSTNGGAGWTKFTAGVPTVSVMDMAIQKRENDLVLGTHGRSIFVIDDYSALRELDDISFKQRLKILSATPGQQYVASATPSTRFTGSGEFRAPNEPYGVSVTFMASGNDLPHPEEGQEKARKQGLRDAATEGEEKDDKAAKPPKVQVSVSDSSGKVIREFKAPVLQGINRLTWNLRSDGVRAMPGPTPPEADADLPAGAEVPPGNYRISLSLGEGDGDAETATEVTVVADPRSGISQADREANYQSLLALQALQETAVSAVERIVNVRKDLDTVTALIARQEGADNLKEQAGDLQKQLNDLELRFRVLPETKGFVYDEDKVISRIGTAQYYIGSSLDAATPGSAAFVELAENSTDAALADLNAFLSGPLQEFREAISTAGVGLLSDAEAVSRSP
jgi:hypothetical protein